MPKLNNKLEEVRSSLGLNKKEFALELNITQNSYTNYINGSRKVPIDIAVILANKYDVSMDWFISGNGDIFESEFTSLINELTIKEKNGLFIAIKKAQESGEMRIFMNHIEKFYIFTSLKQKFKNISSEYSFWKKLFSGTKDKNSFILILAKVLKVLNESAIEYRKISITNAKQELIHFVDNYSLKLGDKVKHFLTDKEKNNLISWINTNISDTDAYIILENIPTILTVLREEINTYNKKAF